MLVSNHAHNEIKLYFSLQWIGALVLKERKEERKNEYTFSRDITLEISYFPITLLEFNLKPETFFFFIFMYV